MNAPKFATVLPDLENELFYGIFDVALDIDEELTVQSEGPIQIVAVRTGVRFQILYPVSSADSLIRYFDLRLKGVKLLEKQSAIGAVFDKRAGRPDTEGRWTIHVIDRARFAQILEALKSEHARRSVVLESLKSENATSKRSRKTATETEDSLTRLLRLAESFHRVVVRLCDRRKDREPVIINDEYDVQYIFAALLESQFDDVRLEEYTPSYAGGTTRVDFFLKKESTFIETKMTRVGLADHKLGDELIIDIEHYKQRADCKSLLCFVYDPEHRLKNPRGLENDLSKQHDSMAVTVLVRPK